MKSTIFALLPFAGFALAESVCERKTVTKTEYEYTSVTVTPEHVVKDQATPKPTTCSRSTVTTTEVEKVTVTVDADDEAGKTIDVTSTSTLEITTTVTIYPSASPLVSSLLWGNYPNATYRASVSAQTTSDLPAFSIVHTPAPAAGEASQSTYPADKPSESASVPASETYTTPEASYVSKTPAAPASSYVSETPATPEQPAAETVTSAAGSKRGEATFYGGNVAGGMCSFTGYTIPSSLYGTALSDSNWDGATACGQCVSVTGPSGTKITAMVVDQCPGCGTNHLDLFSDAFAKLADPSKGVINVSWDFVPCGITSPIVLKNKEGTSPYWFSMQVMNANVGVSKLEVSTDGGASWKATTRQPYNYFENSSGFGTNSVDVKVTSIDGKSIVVKGVSIAASSTKTAGSNF